MKYILLILASSICIVGYALYYYGFSAKRGQPILYLEDLYVKPNYRGEGIGWHVFDWNEKAKAFYKSLGAYMREDLIQVRWE